MKEFKVGDRFLLPDGNDGRLIEVQERDRHSLCDGCFFYDFTCMNRGFGYCDFERRSDHKNVIALGMVSSCAISLLKIWKSLAINSTERKVKNEEVRIQSKSYHYQS